MYSAYLDRLTDDNKALLLIDELQKEFHVEHSSLPTESTVGMWFLVEVEEEEISTIQIDHEKSASMKREIDDRMQRLKSNKRSRFKRK
ncbi:DUF3006 family protein [Sporosarcina sp. G11-34]|uniref:DUF3006 family protein n=1 Tax=Sporosarcina sp. G11-34 TaxID=2849605 RepID=UPI0022A9D1FC|nr:DUF3006 family protein [Sporosarcina sp. G11-34]MCZ2257743.1 DUF3006 domain-containing protein [Sporosarcina sp. G11-34]